MQIVKKSLVLIMSLFLFVSLFACQGTAPPDSDLDSVQPTPASSSAQRTGQLENHMTTVEKSRSSSGSLTLLERDNASSEDVFIWGWEFDVAQVEKIKDSVQELRLYDEELDSDFIIHVTLPPDYDAANAYPMFVMTDGVWRFGDHPALWDMMQSGKVEDVILVSIGYDYALDGTDNAVRGRFYCQDKALFLAFITDNLAPYLDEHYAIDFARSGLYGHSLGGVFTHYAAFNADRFDNQPFQHYIIGSPAFWSPYFLPSESDPPAYLREYGYFERNDSFEKTLYICGGENEDADYAEFYGENDSTLEGIAHLMSRLDGYGVSSATSKIYAGSNHYEYITELFKDFFLAHYPAK